MEQIASNILKQPAGSVERKNTISDFTPEEKARLTSCSMSVVSLDYNGYRLNLLDAPGNDDFVADVVGVLDFVKAAVLVVDTGKIEVGTVKHFNLLKKYGVPTFIFVNKLDKELVNFDEVLEKITGTLGKKGVSFTYPLNDGKVFNGFVDVTMLKAVKADGSKRVEVELDEATKAKVSEMNNALVEQVALTDDALLEKFFSGEELSAEEIANGLKKAVLSGEIAPVIVGSSTENIGVNTLVDMALTYLPSPASLKR